jgi:hypothetical protein
MGGIKGIRDVKGLIFLAKPLFSASSHGHTAQGSPRTAEGSRPYSWTESMT